MAVCQVWKLYDLTRHLVNDLLHLITQTGSDFSKTCTFDGVNAFIGTLNVVFDSGVLNEKSFTVKVVFQLFKV